MIYKCSTCGVLWTNRYSTAKIAAAKAPIQVCSDCSDFDWPVHSKRMAEADKSLSKPKKV